jgi:hypothetical protein
VQDGLNSSLWEEQAGAAGISIKGAFSHKPGDFPRGVSNPETDFSTTYEKVGEQLGSNKGGLYKDPKSGKQFYVKHGTPASHQNEVLANSLYSAAGIDVPNTALINFKGGHSVRSEWLPNPKTHKSNTATISPPLKGNKQLQEGFLVDALLANWDVVGQNFDNIVESDKKFYRVDQGGALNLRAQGKEKTDFHTWSSEYIGELDSMTSDAEAPQASQAFASMSEDTMLAAANKLYKLTDSKISELVDASGLPPKKMDAMADTLIRRRNSIHKWLKDKHPSVLEKADVPSTDFDLLKAINPALEKLKNAPSLWITGFPVDTQEKDGQALEDSIKKVRQETQAEFDTLTGKDTS